MYHSIIAQIVQSLKGVNAWLDKAETYAASKKFDVQVFMDARLAPDMKPLIYQIQSCCDYAKAAAGRLAGQTPPRHDDSETTITEARARLGKTIAFAEGVSAASYQGAMEQKIALPWKSGKVLGGEDYLVQIIIPNVYFHLTMIYAILRHNGIDLGKQDFLGAIRWVDA